MKYAKVKSPTSASTIVSCLQVRWLADCRVNIQSLHFCLPKGDTQITDEDELFDDVRQATKEVRATWYSLAIELDIDYGTRKVRLVCHVVYELYHLKPHPQAIESDYRFVDVCFHAVLRHWVRRASPRPSWSALIRALQSPVISCRDIPNVKQARFTVISELVKVECADHDHESESHCAPLLLGSAQEAGGPGSDDVTTPPPPLPDPQGTCMTCWNQFNICVTVSPR